MISPNVGPHERRVLNNTGDRVWEGLKIGNLEDGEEAPLDQIETGLVIRKTKRSKLERYLDILKVVSEFGPIKRTHILYRANLAWNELRDSLKALEDAEAISQVVTKKGILYEITDTGREIIASYIDIQSSLNRAIEVEARRDIGGFVRATR